MNSKHPLLSIIIPVYNVEKYLAETLDSVIAQDIGFKDNIEIVLVNDGSTDNSEAICKEYKNKYPNNIIYVKQKNAGVSSARNKGINIASGQYIGFLDGDDKYSKDVARKVCDFFEKHYNEIDVVAIKLEFFGAKTGDHMLNFKFYKTRVIDIRDEPECVQLSGGSSFVRAESVKRRHFFDIGLKFAEDAKFLNDLILEKGAYGVVAGPTLFYRKIEGSSSALANSIKDKNYYIDAPKYFSKHFISMLKGVDPNIGKYIQHLVMYDLQWRFNQQTQDVLTEEEEKKYKETLYRIIGQIDDDVIIAQKWIPLERKIFVLKKKYGASYEKRVTVNRGLVYINDVLLWDYAKKAQRFNVDFVEEMPGGRIKIEGYTAIPATNKLKVKLMVNGAKTDVDLVDRKHEKAKTFLGDFIHTGIGLEAILDIKHKTFISGVLTDGSGTDIIMPLSLRIHTRIGNIKRSYRRTGKFLATNIGRNCLKINACSSKELLYSEVSFGFSAFASYLLGLNEISRSSIVFDQKTAQKKLLRNRGGHSAIIATRLMTFVRLFVWQLRSKGPINYMKGASITLLCLMARVWVIAVRKFKRREIWIVSDRPTAAGDNGEALFEYIQKQRNEGIKSYFALEKTSPDFKRMKETGPLLKWGTLRYKLLFLLSDKVVSSHIDDFITNPFKDSTSIYMNLFKFEFIYLNHGINKDDMSFWMNRFDKNTSLFVVAGVPEYKSIIEGNYYYPKEKVVLSGFPRYDKLFSEPKSKLILAPTWRKFIANEHDTTNGDREYDERFMDTEYFKFYEKLIGDSRVRQKLKEQGMTAEFYLHPAHRSQLRDFKGNEVVEIMQYPYDYASAFKEGSVLLTDYSSVAFDFAYMKKPVIFAQFDEKEFFGKHWVRGYFSYDNDGMGPVVRDYESTVKEVIKVIENNCVMEDKYKKRVDDFFAYTDRKNSERVYKAILDMPK